MIFERYRRLIEDNIMKFVPKAQKQYELLSRAMEYSLESGGKRVRPVLTLAFCELGSGAAETALPFACAVEFVHTYSLIHDDLPCMDNDDMRRGKPSSHKKFGEAQALLAGDALLTHAFSCIAESEASDGQKAKAVACLADLCGVNGMIGGQVIDINGENASLGLDELFLMDSLKTSALISAACSLGCIAANRYDLLESAQRYARHLGIAFQIIDDILDYLEGEQNSDIVSGKSTYVSLLGVEGAKELAQKHTQSAIDALRKIDGDTAQLVEYSRQLLSRQS